MDLGLKNKVAVVGGGSRGLGKAIASRLVGEGCRVAIIARHQKDLDGTSRELDPKKEGIVLPFACDLSDLSQIPPVVKKIKNQFKTVHILVNNAGGPRPGKLGDVSEEDWLKTLDQNLRSVIVMTQEVLPMMRAQRFGRVLNITSQYAKEPNAAMILSNTARAGVLAFAKTISQELAPLNITVNSLCPGPILTDRMKFLMEDRAKKEKKGFDEIRNNVQALIPVGRLGKPDELACVAAFLASDCASFVTGTTLAVDGGMTKGLF